MALKKRFSQLLRHWRQRRGGKPQGGAGTGPKRFALFDFEKLSQKIFSPESRPRIHRLFLMGAFLAFCYSAGKGVGLWLTGSAPQIVNREIPFQTPRRAAGQNWQQLAKSDLFGPTRRTGPEEPERPQIRPDVPCLRANRPSSLPIKLLNTVVLQDTVKSVASVQVRNQQEIDNLREGDPINNMAKVGKIKRLQVVLKNLQTGDCEYIENQDQWNRTSGRGLRVLGPQEGERLMQQQSGELQGIKAQGDDYTICQSFLDKKLENIGQVLTEAKGTPFENPDGSISFRISQVEPGSLFAALGVENGDVITSLNGEPIKAMNEVMTLFGKIQNIRNLQIGLERDGTTITRDYTFDSSKDCE